MLIVVSLFHPSPFGEIDSYGLLLPISFQQEDLGPTPPRTAASAAEAQMSAGLPLLAKALFLAGVSLQRGGDSRPSQARYGKRLEPFQGPPRRSRPSHHLMMLLLLLLLLLLVRLQKRTPLSPAAFGDEDSLLSRWMARTGAATAVDDDEVNCHADAGWCVAPPVEALDPCFLGAPVTGGPHKKGSCCPAQRQQQQQQPQRQQQQLHPRRQKQQLQEKLQGRHQHQRQQQQLQAPEAHQQQRRVQQRPRRYQEHLGRQFDCKGVERLRMLQSRLKQRWHERQGPRKRHCKQQQQHGQQRDQPHGPSSEQSSSNQQQFAGFPHCGGVGNRRRSSSTSTSSSGRPSSGSTSRRSGDAGRCLDEQPVLLSSWTGTFGKKKLSAAVVSSDGAAGGSQYAAAGPQRNLLWAIRRSRVEGSTSSIRYSGGPQVKALAHATAIQHLLLPLPLGFAPFVCMAGATACGAPKPQLHPTQGDRGCCSWQLLLSLGGEGGGRLLQIGASATYTIGAQSAAQAPETVAAAEALALARPEAADSGLPAATAASASARATAPVQWPAGSPHHQQVQAQRREAEHLETRNLPPQREASAAAPVALPLTHAGAAVAYVAAAAGGRLVDVEVVGSLAVCCLRSSGSSLGGLVVHQASSSTSSHLMWARQNAAADAWACASSLSAAPSAAAAVASSSPLFVLAGRQPAMQLLQGREGQYQLQQLWSPKGPAQRLVPRTCCAAAFSASDSAAAGFAGVALVGSTRGELLAIDPRCSLPSRLLRQNFSHQDTSCCNNGSISCIRVLRRHVAGVMIRHGMTGLQLLDLRFVSETSRLMSYGRGVSACVLREYRPARRQGIVGVSGCSSSMRWEFACDEREELVAAPFPSDSSSAGSFLLFDVNSADCCREIAAAPAALTAADVGGEAPPFELFGCCCLLPRAAADFTRVSVVEQEVSVNPLHRENYPPVFHSQAQQTRVCGLKPCCSEATTAREGHQHRFECVYGWECFCNEGYTFDESKERAMRACCALLRLGGWPSAVQAKQSIAAAAAVAGEERACAGAYPALQLGARLSRAALVQHQAIYIKSSLGAKHEFGSA
ncbi:hypothetical protein Emag_001893 [Eimeria magna]